jgi:hypothetical protein
VERIAPALERQREVARGAQRVKATRKRKATSAKRASAKRREKAVQNFGEFGEYGMPIRREAERIWKLLADVHGGRPLPRITVRVSRMRENADGTFTAKRTVRGASNALGLSYGGLIALGAGCSWFTLCHELVHEADRHKRGRTEHDETFYRMIRIVTERRWKVTLNTYGVRWDASSQWEFERQVAHRLATAWKRKPRSRVAAEPTE